VAAAAVSGGLAAAMPLRVVASKIDRPAGRPAGRPAAQLVA
jgi:hypothetical protein